MWTFIFLIVMALGKAAADTLQYRYQGSVFFKWGLHDSIWGKFWAMWTGPDSWNNKNQYQNPVVLLLMRTAFAWLNDGWHFFQMIMLTAGQAAIAINLELQLVPWPFWNAVILIMGMKLIMGLVFEFGWNGIFISPSMEKRVLDRQAYKVLNTDQWKTGILAAYPSMKKVINWAMVGVPFLVLTLGHQAGLLPDWLVVACVFLFFGTVFFLVRQLYRR